MYPYIHIILPSYSVLALLGAFIALFYIYFRLEKFHIEFTVFLKMFAICIVCGVLGSKLLFAITQIPWLIENFSISNMLLLIPQSGYVFYGGLFGVLLAICIYTKGDEAFRNNVMKLIAPAIPLFHGFGRLGCLFAGCCYGKLLHVPIKIGDILEYDRVPVQMMESLYEFMLFVILIIIENKKPKYSCLKIYLITYAVFRFLIEFLRGDIVRGLWLGLSTSQWVSLFIIAFIILKELTRKKLSKKDRMGGDEYGWNEKDIYIRKSKNRV